MTPQLLEWLSQTTWQVSVLILLVLGIQKVFAKQLAPRWRHALWLVVVARLFLPIQMESAFSVFNWVPSRGPHFVRQLEPWAGVADDAVPARAMTPLNVAPSSSSTLSLNVPAHSPPALAGRQLRDPEIEPGSAVQESTTMLWPRLAVAIWLGGVGLFGLRLVIQHLRFERRIRQARPVEDPAVLGQLKDCGNLLGVRRALPLLETRAVSSPALYGLFRPRLLLPLGVVTSFSPSELRHVFLHEQAHYARHDLVWSALASVGQAVHWFNPLVWVALWRMHTDRELACDARVLETAGDDERAAYGRTILKLLERSAGAAAVPGAVGIVEGKSAIRERLRMIRRHRPSRLISVVSASVLTVVAVIGLTDGETAVPGRPATPADSSTTGRSFELRVIAEEDRQPVPTGQSHCVVFYRFAPDGVVQTNLPFAQGRLVLDLGERPMALMVTVIADGRVPKILSWRPHQQDPIPDVYTVALAPGTTVGGVVHSESGRPVAGAKIRMVHRGLSDYAEHETPRERLGLGWEDVHVETTDAEGRWTCNHWPAGYEDVGFTFKHPDFQDAGAGVDTSSFGGDTRFAMDQLHNRTALMVLTSGLTLSGVVVNLAGDPVAGATVALGAHHEGSLKATSATDGSFTIPNAAPGDAQWLTVSARGLAPERKPLSVTEQPEPLRIELADGGVLRGVVKDASGQPVSGVMVALQDWRGNNSLEWRVTTDAQGSFRWESAPLDEAEYFVGKPGFTYVRGLRLIANGSLHEVILRPSIRVTGKVIDQRTQDPIASFRVVPGYDENRWHAGSTIHGANGTYEIVLEEPSNRFAVRIEAEGYAPSVSPWFDSAAGTQVFDAALGKGGLIRGVVLLPDGSPAAGAQVALCTKSRGLGIGRGRLIQDGPRSVPAVGPDGAFEVTPDPEAHLLVAIHPQGVARVPLEDLAPDPTIRLQAFGSIEGTVVLQGKPGAGEKVAVLDAYSHPELRGPSLDLTSFTAPVDAEGRFGIDSLPPGEWAVYLWPKAMGTPFTHKTLVEVFPGKITSASIRSQGRPVIGKVLVPNLDTDIDWKTQAQSGSMIRTRQEIPRPPTFKDQDEYQAWANTYYASEAYKALQRTSRTYALLFDQDGTFRAEDVAPGTYELNLVLREPSADSFEFGKHLGSVTTEIVVPAFDGEWSDQPFNAGVFEITLRNSLKPGNPAPPFATKTMDGKPLRLEDFRGRFVLLDFWATWCGPCVAEQPNLRATWDAFGDDPRFAMVGLSLDGELEPLQVFVEKHDVPWTQAWLGPWSDSQLPSQYGVFGIPSIFLIDPEGNILATDLRGDAIKAAVQHALATP